MKDQLVQYQTQCRTLLQRLGEQDRRHVAGLLALITGHGGAVWVAEVTVLQRECVTRGKNEVAEELKDCPKGRQRKPGGGRKPLEKKVLKSSKSSRKSSLKTLVEYPPENENSSD